MGEQITPEKDNKNNMNRNRPTYEWKGSAHLPTITSSVYPHRETKRNGDYEPSSSLLHARYGIYNDRNVETTATTTGLFRKERTGQGLEQAGGRRYARKYVHANLALSLSVSSSLRISTTTTTQTSHLKLIRPKPYKETDEDGDTRTAGGDREGGRSPKKASKHLGNGVLYIHPQEGGGRSSVLWLWCL